MTVTPLGSFSTAPRRGDGCSRADASMMVSSETPISSAVAAAATTFMRWPRPSSGTARSRSPNRVTRRARDPSRPRSSTSTARTVAPSLVPNVTVRPGKPAARAITSESSALATSSVSAVACSRISALASAMAAADPKWPMWASPTLVQMRTSGVATPTSVRISPA
jgi:hypothetical protein